MATVTDHELIAGYDPTRDASGYWYSEDHAENAVGFIADYCTHVKGRAARKPYEPNPWEADAIRALFGWRDDRGMRRFREAFIAVARKNNKTTLCAALALYLLLCDGEGGAEIYLAASDRDQASLCFDIAAGMTSQDADLSKRLKVRKHYRRLIYEDTNSFIRAIPANVDASHGFNASACIIDELHAQPSRDLYDVLKTSMGAREQPLMLSITTAGYDRDTICHEVWQHARQVRDGTLSDPTFLPIIYEADDADNWESPDTWRKANPNLGRSISLEYLEEQHRRAKQTAGYENTFRRLHLNQWTDAESRWITSADWDACRVNDWPDLTGCDCYIGVDLASTEDVTAVVAIVVGDDDKWYVVPRLFVPDETINKRAKKYHTQYREWVKTGQLLTTPGAVTDYEFIRNAIYELAEQYTVRAVAFDPWQAMDTHNELAEAGFMSIKVPQTFAGLSPGIKAIEAAVLGGTLKHDGNDVMGWMMACTVLDLDGAGNRKPSKRKSHGARGTKGKIDGIVALVMAGAQVGQVDDAGADAELYI